MATAVKYNFEGKRALVTGVGRGIGRDIAKALSAAGAVTYGLSVTKDNLDSLVAECPNISPVHVDLADWKSTEKAVQALGPIDLLVNNAGRLELLPFFTVTEESCDRIFNVNVKAMINVSQVVAKGMVERKSGGAIVNISSIASKRALYGYSVYGSSKGAVDQLTRIMALELGPHQIRVNSVNPTIVMTDMGKITWADPARSEPMRTLTPLGRFAEPKDITNTVLYLLSDSADTRSCSAC